MTTFKKLISIAAATAIVCTASVTSFAVDPTGDSTTITYNVDSGFTITIPDALTIDADNKTGTVSLNAGSLIEPGKKITFTITGATNYDNENSSFRLQNTTDSSVYLDYGITRPDTPDPIDVEKDTAFLEVIASEAYTGKNVVLTYNIDTPEIAGTYTDIITIAVAKVNV